MTEEGEEREETGNWECIKASASFMYNNHRSTLEQ